MAGQPEIDRELVDQLQKSKETIGEAYAIVVDIDGEVLSGRHRKEAGWQKQTVLNTEILADRKGVTRTIAKEMAKIHLNIQRKPSTEETQQRLIRIAEEFRKQGVLPGSIVSKVKSVVPYTEAYISKLLPDEYKLEQKVKAGEIGASAKLSLAESKDLRESIVHPCKCPIIVAHSTNSEGKCVRYDFCIWRKDPRCPAKGSTTPMFRVDTSSRRVECGKCGCQTSFPKEYKGGQYCPECFEKLTKKETEKPAPPPPTTPTVVEPSKPVVQTPPPTIIKPKETWEQRLATMHPPKSRMEQDILLGLNEGGYHPETDREFCLVSTKPDFTFDKLVVYLDGPLHQGREDRDRSLRELLAKRYRRKVLSIPYEEYNQTTRENILNQILQALKEVS